MPLSKSWKSPSTEKSSYAVSEQNMWIDGHAPTEPNVWDDRHAPAELNAWDGGHAPAGPSARNKERAASKKARNLTVPDDSNEDDSGGTNLQLEWAFVYMDHLQMKGFEGENLEVDPVLTKIVIWRMKKVKASQPSTRGTRLERQAIRKQRSAVMMYQH